MLARSINAIDAIMLSTKPMAWLATLNISSAEEYTGIEVDFLMLVITEPIAHSVLKSTMGFEQEETQRLSSTALLGFIKTQPRSKRTKKRNK